MTEITNDAYNGKPAETQALCACADAWVRKNVVEMDEEWQADIESLEKLPPTYRQAKFLQQMFLPLDDEKNVQWMQQMKLTTPFGMIFCGASGCGKTETAYSFMKELQKLECSQHIELTGTQLNIVSKKQAKEYVRAVFRYAEQNFSDSNGYLIVLFHRIQQSKISRWIMEFVAAQDSEAIFPIFVDNDPECFPDCLTRLYPMIVFPMPTCEDRLEFFRYDLTGTLQPELWNQQSEEEDEELTAEEQEFLQQNVQKYTDAAEYSDGLENLQYTIEISDLSYEQLAEQTDGFSYQQLKQLTDMMRFHLISMLTESDTTEIIDAAKALTKGGVYQIKDYAVREMIQMLKWQAVRKPVQQIPLSYSYAAPQMQMPEQTQTFVPRQADGMHAAQAPDKIRQAANGGHKDYTYLAEYFTGSVSDRFGREQYGAIKQEYVNMKDTESDLKE